MWHVCGAALPCGLFAGRPRLADYGEPMAYDDGTVACTDEALIIRRYYFPPRAKRIPYSKIRQVRRVPLGSMGWRVKTWGSSDLIHWFNEDGHRSGKSDAFIIQLTGRIRPVITPDHPDEVTAELTAHGVNVTSG